MEYDDIIDANLMRIHVVGWFLIDLNQNLVLGVLGDVPSTWLENEAMTWTTTSPKGTKELSYVRLMSWESA
jgi:hypothetical protein